MPSLFNKAFINKVEKELEKQALEQCDRIALEAFTEVVQINPVDTGVSRAGWNLSINVIDSTRPAKPAKGSVLPAPKMPSVKLKKLGDEYHLANFVEYTLYLNEGAPAGTQHSQKAPLNFVETAVHNAVKSVQKSF